MRRTAIVLVLVGLVLALAATAAQSAVRKVSITSPVVAGKTASLTVNVAPRAACTIAVAANTSVSTQRGLGSRTGGRISWRWRVKPNARPGRSPVIVRCGKAGTLRTSFVIAAPEIPLATAKTAACTNVPVRVLGKYRTELIPLLERTLQGLREQYGAFDCAYGSNYYKDGGPLSYYLVSVARGTSPCTFAVTARVVWVSDPPLPGYTGPKDEKYTETCATLRG